MTSVSASNSPQTLSVAYIVGAARNLVVNPASVAFSTSLQRGPPAERRVDVTSGSGGALTGLAVGSIEHGSGPTGWLSATLSGGSTPAVLTLTPTSTLGGGSFTARVSVTSDNALNSPQFVTVDYSVGAPRIQVSAHAGAFAAREGGALPPAKTIAISNAGTGTLYIALESVDYSGSDRAGWLDVTLSSATAPATLTLRPNSTTLPAGTYHASSTSRPQTMRREPPLA